MEPKQILREMDALRNPQITCPASRHTALAAECLIKGGEYFMCEDEPEHIGQSMAVTVKALWEARTMLCELGYEQQLSEDRKSVFWAKKETA